MNRRRALRWGLAAVAAAVVIVVVTSVALTVTFVRRPLPQRGGDVTLPGLAARVTVRWEGRGVPQVYAETAADLFRAQGYVQASDRFFEMDLRRHLGSGRLAELVGNTAGAVESDVVVRTLGLRQVAEREVALASPATRAVLDAYAAGVNDYLRDRSASQLSVNYTLLSRRHRLPRIEPWTPADSLTWLKALAWSLRSNYTEELDRARIYATVRDVGRVDDVFPPYPYDQHPPILAAGEDQAGGEDQANGPLPAGARARMRAGAPATSAAGVTRALTSEAGVAAVSRTASALASLAAPLAGPTGEIGSNTWVVSGRHTATGKPLLAADPHLAVSMPGVWYQMGLHCARVDEACPYDVAGFTMAGVPGVVNGHNGRIAWALSNSYADVTDFFLERVNGDGVTYLRDGEEQPLRARQERIGVAGGRARTITVRTTVHGPLLSDAAPTVAEAGRRAPVPEDSPTREGGYAVALAWTGLQPGRTLDALLGIARATDFASFREAAMLLSAPAQNLVYADVDGHIGYQSPGLVPVRGKALPGARTPADGSWPQPGWDSRADWQGFVPAQQLPWALDPASGFIVAANQAVTRSGRSLGRDVDYGYRSARITARLAKAVREGKPLSVADMEELQLDSSVGIAPVLVPRLLRIQVDPFTRSAQDLLRGWDYSQRTDSAAAAYYNAVWAALLDLGFGDETPDGSGPDGGSRWSEAVRTLLSRPDDAWWDNRRTSGLVETRDEILRQALVQARLRLTSTLGKDPKRWQWGRLHRVRLVSPPLGGEGSSWLVHRLVNRGPYPAPGGSSAVDAFAWDAAGGRFDVTSAPSMRMVVDLAYPDRSVWVNATGNSGHPTDDHYDDQVDDWLHGRALPWPFSAGAVQAATDRVLRLVPPQP